MRRTVALLFAVLLGVASPALAKFLAASKQAGRTLVEVVSPRDRVLLRADGANVEDVDACILADVERQPAGETYDYEVKASVPGGDGMFSTHYERVRGKKQTDPNEEHRVDVASTSTPGAALGHMVRANIEMSKQMVGMAKTISDLGASALRENRRLHVRLIEGEGEVGLTKMVLTQEHETKMAWTGRLESFLGRVLSLGEGALAGRGALPAKGGAGAVSQESVVADFKRSLTNVQRARIREIVGAEAWEDVLLAATPAELADVMLDRVGPEKTHRILTTAGLEPAQIQRFALMCKPRFDERKAKEAEAKKVAVEAAPLPPKDEGEGGKGGGDGQAS